MDGKDGRTIWKFGLWKIPEGCIYEECGFGSEELAKEAAETERTSYFKDHPDGNPDDCWTEAEPEETAGSIPDKTI